MTIEQVKESSERIRAHRIERTRELIKEERAKGAPDALVLKKLHLRLYKLYNS